MMDSVFVSVGGDEAELRPISARQYLSARAEARKLGEGFGEDPVGEAVLLCAALLTRALYIDGEAVFQSADEVLDRLTAEEITVTAGYLQPDPDIVIQAAEDIKRVSAALYDSGGENADDVQDELEETAREKARAEQPGEEQKTVKREAEADTSEGMRESGFEEAVIPRPKRVRAFDSPASSYTGGTTEVYEPAVRRRTTPRTEMRRVSDFFQRDSRRYDGNIIKY